MSNTPSDAELDELIFDVYPTYQAPEALDRIQIREAMKKAVAKWGTPQPVVREPQPMPDLTQLTERGATAWAGVDAQALRVGLEPLNYNELHAISLKYSDSEDECTGFRDGWRAAEKHHGVTQKGGK